MKISVLFGIAACGMLLLLSCSPMGQTQQSTSVPSTFKLPGKQLGAFLAAYSSLQSNPDLSQKKKRIENYTVEFTDGKENYYIRFMPKYVHKPNTVHVGGETEFGKDARYTIRKKDMKVIERVYFR